MRLIPMAFVLDTNFIVTLHEIGHLNALNNLKNNLKIPQPVKDEVDSFRIDLTPIRTKLSIVTLTTGDVESFIKELAKNLNGKITFVLELKNDYNAAYTPVNWVYFPNVILKAIPPHAYENIITNNPKAGLIIERTEFDRILAHADVHVCATITTSQNESVMTMDASIWMALHTINSQFSTSVYPIFGCLRLLFRDDPVTFIDALTQVVVKKRYKFVKNIVDSVAARFCYEDLIKSVDEVLQRHLASLINENSWSQEKSNYIQLIKLRREIRNIVEKNSKCNGELTFNDEQFINDLNTFKSSLISLKTVK